MYEFELRILCILLVWLAIALIIEFGPGVIKRVWNYIKRKWREKDE